MRWESVLRAVDQELAKRHDRRRGRKRAVWKESGSASALHRAVDLRHADPQRLGEGLVRPGLAPADLEFEYHEKILRLQHHDSKDIRNSRIKNKKYQGIQRKGQGLR